MCVCSDVLCSEQRQLHAVAGEHAQAAASRAAHYEYYEASSSDLVLIAVLHADTVAGASGGSCRARTLRVFGPHALSGGNAAAMA